MKKYNLGETQLKIIKEIINNAEIENKSIFVKGGWNIDLSYGKQTREHGDIDFHYDLRDKKYWRKFFEARGYSTNKQDDWYTIFKNNGVQIDFEGFKLSGNNITWKHGGTAKLEEVCKEKKYDDFRFKGMKLGVEKFLKEKATNEGQKMREKDKHDFKIIDKLKKGL